MTVCVHTSVHMPLLPRHLLAKQQKWHHLPAGHPKRFSHGILAYRHNPLYEVLMPDSTGQLVDWHKFLESACAHKFGNKIPYAKQIVHYGE